MKRGWRCHQTTVVLFLCLGVLAGTIMGRQVALPVSALFLSIILGAFIWRKRSVATLMVFLLIGTAIGISRASNVYHDLQTYNNIYNQPVAIRGVAASDGVYADQGQVEFDMDHLYLNEPYQRELRGRIQVRGHGVASVIRGDQIVVEGKLFKTGGARQGRISFAEVSVESRSSFIVEKIRRQFYAGVSNALPEPAAPFALGLLLGSRSELPDVTNNTLRNVGLAHLVAVSGYNLTILVRLARKLGSKLSKFQSLLIATMLIVSFLLLTGFSASIVRAAIVSGLSIWAGYYGRSIKPVLLILFAAAVTALYNPNYMWSDIGWYLSFLAFFGILVLAPLLIKRLKINENRAFTASIIEAFAAQVMTLPLILYLFNTLPLFGLLANVLVVPLVPYAMIASLVAGVAGMISPEVGGVAALPAKVILTYMLDVATIISRIPNAVVSRSLSIHTMSLAYAFLGFLVLGLYRRQRPQHGTITDIIKDL